MKPADRFISELERSVSQSHIQNRDIQYYIQSFVSLCAPRIGRSASESLSAYWEQRYVNSDTAGIPKLAYIASFILEEYEETSMPLCEEDFTEIRDTLNDAAEEIDMDVLTDLMAALVSLGYLH